MTLRSLVKCSFYYSSSDSSGGIVQLRAGILNEDMLIKAIPNFFDVNSTPEYNFKILCINNYGLLLRESIGASVDGIGVLQHGVLATAEKELCVIEVKTRVSVTTQTEAKRLKRDYGPITVVNFGTDVCKKLIEKAHLAQLVHNAAVTNLQTCVYVVGDLRMIYYVVIVNFTETTLLNYRKMMNKIIDDCYPWIKEVYSFVFFRFFF